MADNDLNEEVVVIVEDAEVITTPIDATLTISGDAADAKAVGDALALKADISQITGVSVNGQDPDAQGKIIVYGTQIEMSDSDDTKVQSAIATIGAKTGADIPVNSQIGAVSIEQAISAAAGTAMTVSENTLNVTGEITDDSTAMNYLKMGTSVLPVTDKNAVKSVNNVLPGSSGNVQISTVDAARQLVSENTQLVEGAFIRRTSGGNASIGTGDAYLGVIRGNSVHTGVVDESFTTTVTSSALEPITADVTTQATFRTQAEEGGTYDFNYTTGWDVDPATWGITVTGTPTSGDTITVVWVEADRGTITTATPTAFTGSNWNLYNNTVGYARVLKYSDSYGFCISGAYTALKFSATLSGTQTAITPVNDTFTVPSDGYVWVTGGNGTNTAIWMQESDWTESHDGGWEAHHEDIISLTDVMENFPNGLCSVGDVRDEINLNTQEAQVRIERMEYSVENLADVISAGRAYDADENYIYAVYADADMPDPIDIELDGSYSADDHGMEWFDDTDVSVYTQIIYGENLVDKLRTDVVTISQQSLTWSQKGQVLQNLGFNYFKWADDAREKTFSQFVDSIKSFATDSVINYQVSTAIGQTLLGASNSLYAICMVQKISSSKAQYFVANRNGSAVGNISLSDGAVTIYWSSVNQKVVSKSTEIADKSVPNDTNTLIGSFQLAAGDYMIIITGSWAQNATGYRDISLCDSNGTQLNLASRNIVQAVNGAVTRHQLPIAYNTTSQTTLYVYGKQNSGSALTVSTRYAIIRIK